MNLNNTFSGGLMKKTSIASINISCNVNFFYFKGRQKYWLSQVFFAAYILGKRVLLYQFTHRFNTKLCCLLGKVSEKFI